MKTQLMVILICIGISQVAFAQDDDGMASLVLPVRNSLTFNRYAINPTFSFVREQSKYISLFNKREWVQFEDAPLTYLASYSGRFGENIGAGLGIFQQNYGVLTTFGGVLNFAYNIRLASDSNLTFGMNVGTYKSGIATGNVVTNNEDPSLQNVPEYFMMSISPGINYGLEFIDFGVSINNLVSYNFESSSLNENNYEQGLQGHLMYTGYMNSRGFFDQSKFSGLIKSEFRKNETIISGQVMLTVPKGIWAQLGYNSYYGSSAGLGLNLTKEIAIEYNYETAMGDLTEFGPSHDITLAYRFNNNDNYDYSSGDEVSGLISTTKKRRRPKPLKLSKAEVAEKRKQAAERKAENEVRLAAEQEAKAAAEAEAKLLAEQKAKEAADAKLIEEQKAQQEAEAKAKLLAEQKAKEEVEARARQLAERKAKEEAEAKAKLLAEQTAQEEAEARARQLAEQKAKAEAEARARQLAEQKAKEDAEAKVKLLAEQQAREEAEAKAKILAEQKAAEERITNPKDELGKSMYALTQKTEISKAAQSELLKKYDDIIEIKDKDLKDLKEENDLSEQGITVELKPFKSIAEENKVLSAIKADLDAVIQKRNEEIEALEALYEEKFEVDTIELDEVYLYYKNTLERLKAEQIRALEARAELEIRLEQINVATEFERNRRIKRALFDNEDDRYIQDRATLQNIKQTTDLSNTPLKVEDFDFGEEQSSNIQILKNVKNVNNGYYLIIAVHSDIQKRNEFVRKVVASGRMNVDFFYDVNTSKYYIYYDKFDSIEAAANEGLKSKGTRPYNSKMSIVKIEN